MGRIPIFIKHLMSNINTYSDKTNGKFLLENLHRNKKLLKPGRKGRQGVTE
jgi:hypothetical protein